MTSSGWRIDRAIRQTGDELPGAATGRRGSPTFEPAGPLDGAVIDDSLEEIFLVDEGSIEKATQKLGQRLGVLDIE